jgi:hypothetical protein
VHHVLDEKLGLGFIESDVVNVKPTGGKDGFVEF